MLIDQPNAKTVRKVKVASWTAAWVAPLATVLAGVTVSLLPGELARYEMELSLLMTFAITGIGTWVAGYYTRERA